MNESSVTLQELGATIERLGVEVKTLRRGQLKTLKSINELRHEFSHRLGTSREDLAALIKASHTDLMERFNNTLNSHSENTKRLTRIEHELDDLFSQPT